MPTALAVALLVVSFAGDPVVVFEKRSPFATVLVVDEGPLRYLRFESVDAANQSVVDTRDPRAVPMEYLRVATAGLAFTPGRRRALVIGLGGGAFPMLLFRSFPAMAIDAVDIDPVVAEVARRFFGLAEDARLRVAIEDGAAFVARAPAGAYDLVLLDAYGTSGIPAALATPAFFAGVRRLLAPGGAAVANVTREPEHEEVLATFARAFGSCTLLHGEHTGNAILVATLGPAPTALHLEGQLRRVSAEARLPFALEAVVKSVGPCPRGEPRRPRPTGR